MHASKRDMLSARNTSLYAYGMYHTRTRMVYKIVPYTYGMYHTRMVQNSGMTKAGVMFLVTFSAIKLGVALGHLVPC